MDCFKIEAETLSYLKAEQQTFTSIIQTLGTLTKLNEPILYLFPQYKYHQKQGENIQKQLLTNRKSARYDIPLQQTQPKQKQKVKQQTQVDEVEEEYSPHDAFWIGIVQKPKTKEKKYLMLLDIACAFFKICNTKRQNGVSHYSRSKKSNNNNIVRSQLVQRQFQSYIRQYTNGFSNLSNLPLLVKMSYRLQQINRAVYIKRDLISIKQYCLKLKQVILADGAKESVKQKQRNDFIEVQSQKIKNQQKPIIKDQEYYTYEHLNVLQLKKKNKGVSITEDKDEDIRKTRPKQVTIMETISQYSIYSPQQTLLEISAESWLEKYRSIPKVEEYKNIFIWKLDSCILLIKEILGKQTFGKEEFIKYLKMGQAIRQKYQITNNNNSKTRKLERIVLQQIIVAYSSIAKFANKLKQFKYYDMLVMELQICYRKAKKMNKLSDKQKQSNMSNPSYESNNNSRSLSNKSNNNPSNDFDKKYNRKKMRQPDPISQDNHNDVIVAQSVSVQKSKKAKFIEFKVPDQIIKYNNTRTRNNSNHSNSNRNSKQQRMTVTLQKRRSNIETNVNYNFVQKQLESIQIKKEQQTFNDYFNEDQYFEKEKQFKQIQINNKRMQLFTRSLNYLTQRTTNASSVSQLKQSMYHINLGKTWGSKDTKKTSKSQSRNSNKTSHYSFGTYPSVYSLSKLSRNPTKTSSFKKISPQVQSNCLQPRKAVLIKRQSFKKQIQNLVSITKRSIKPGRYFDQIKDEQDNLYRDIISTEQRVTVLTNQLLQQQMFFIHRMQSQKPTPIFEQILMITKIKDKLNRGQKDDSVTISSNINQNSSQHMTISETQVVELTMIQCFCHEVGYVAIKVVKSDGRRQNSISYTSEMLKIYSQKLTIASKSILKQGQDQKNNFIICKDAFSYEQLKKQISSSQFYFQLIQQSMQKKIDTSDIHIISKYIQSQLYNKYFSTQRSEDKSILKQPEQEQQKQNQSNRIQSLLIICMGRISHSLLYWYYTKGSKINGNILLKRQIPSISDPLKFAIALDFMKKYDHKKCLEKLSHVRNKKALYECFKYLFYGRKIIAKGLLLRKHNFVFYTLSIERFSQKNFQIKTKEEGGSQFQDLQLVLTIYSRNNWHILQVTKYPIYQVLSQQKVTLMILSSLVQDHIPPHYLSCIVQDIQFHESEHFFSYDNLFFSKNYNLSEPTSEQKQRMMKMHQVSHEQTANKIIVNFVHLLMWYVDIKGGSLDLTVKTTFKQIVQVDKQWISIEAVHLGCGLIFQIMNNVKNKGKCQQIVMYSHQDIDSKPITEYLMQNESQSKRNTDSMKIIKYNQMLVSSFAHINKYSKNKNQQKQRVKDQPFGQVSGFKNINKKVSQIFQEKLQNNFDGKIRPMDKIIYTLNKCPYQTSIVLKSPLYPNRRIVNKIKKSIIQKQVMDCLEALHKRIIRTKSSNENNNQEFKKQYQHVYVCLSYNVMIKAYRLDVYHSQSSKRYAGYFRLNQENIYFQQSINQHEKFKDKGFKQINQNYRDKQYYESYYGLDKKIQNHQKILPKSKVDNQSLKKQSPKKNRWLNQTGHKQKYIKSPFKLQHQNHDGNLTQQKPILVKGWFRQSCIKIDANFKQLSIQIDNVLACFPNEHRSHLNIPLFQTFNNISTFGGSRSNKGNIELIQYNNKLLLLVLLEGQPNLYVSQVDDNIFMNNTNLFADYSVKQYTTNLYNDLFMRMYGKFITNSLTIIQAQHMKDIANM